MNNEANIDWVFWGHSGVIKFPGGGTVFLQGEEASELDDRVEACETAEEINNVLCDYEHLVN